VANKGVDVLLRAAADLAGIELVILGDGPELPRLRELATHLGIAETTRFLGWVPPETVQRELSDSTLLAVPSLWPEPFGLVALEAAALGVPVVASSVGGLRDVVADGETGLLAPPGNVSRWTYALRSILDQPELASAMGQASVLACRQRFSLSSHLAALESVYRHALGGPI
jgi:glycosyltransferase involved in cell wall biosynthesis